MNARTAPYFVTALVVLLACFWLLHVGRVPYCECGYVKLFDQFTIRHARCPLSRLFPGQRSS